MRRRGGHWLLVSLTAAALIVVGVRTLAAVGVLSERGRRTEVAAGSESIKAKLKQL